MYGTKLGDMLGVSIRPIIMCDHSFVGCVVLLLMVMVVMNYFVPVMVYRSVKHRHPDITRQGLLFNVMSAQWKSVSDCLHCVFVCMSDWYVSDRNLSDTVRYGTSCCCMPALRRCCVHIVMPLPGGVHMFVGSWGWPVVVGVYVMVMTCRNWK